MRWGGEMYGTQNSHILYLATIGALMYLANYTRPTIAFVVKGSARFSAKSTKQYWNILQYLKGMDNPQVFYKLERIATSKDMWMHVTSPIHIKRNLSHTLCFPYTRSNDILEVNKVESCSHIFKPFKKYSLAWGFTCMCLIAIDWWLHQRLLWISRCLNYSNGNLQRQCNLHCSNDVAT